MADPTPDAATERAEWLAERRKGIGASDVAGILGISPWASPWSVWADKVGLTTDDEPTDAMLRGLYAEHVIAPMYEHRTGHKVEAMQLHCAGRESWMKATIDGRRADSSALVEMKDTTDSPAAWVDGPPDHYAAQATWQSLVTGCDHVDFAVMHHVFGRLQFEVYPYTPTEKNKQYLMQRCSRFWHANVLAGLAPEADGHRATTQALNHAWGDDPTLDDELLADDSLVTAVAKLRDLKLRAKAVKAEQAEIENRIKSRLADCTVASRDGEPIATWKPSTVRRIDTKRLRSDHPGLADEYTNETVERRLLTPTPKPTKKDNAA